MCYYRRLSKMQDNGTSKRKTSYATYFNTHVFVFHHGLWSQEFYDMNDFVQLVSSNGHVNFNIHVTVHREKSV